MVAKISILFIYHTLMSELSRAEVTVGMIHA
jgi:hypothetical protein